MTDKVKSIEKHLKIVSQTHQRMRDLQDKIIELEEWRSTEKKIPSSLPTIKGYDIIVYSIATEECQDLASRFDENARKHLVGMMDLYKESTYDIQRYIRWPEINLEDEHLVPFTLFDQLESDYEKVKVEVQSQRGIFSRRYPRTPCNTVDGVLPLFSICTQICGNYGGVQEMKYIPWCQECPHLQPQRGKDPVSTRGMEQTLLQGNGIKLHYCKILL